MNKEREREKRLLSTHRHFRYRCMRARALEKRTRGCRRRAKGEGEEGRRKRRFGVGGREEMSSLVRGGGGGGGKRGPFSEKRSYVSLPETVLFFYKFRRPCRRRKRRVPKGTRDSFPSSTNERQLCPHEGLRPSSWNVTAPYTG